MSTKAERRATYENRVDQDGRLTGKHIKTLLHLQDLHSENDLLKARIAELELQQAKAARCDLLEREVEKLRGDLSKCQELHQIANDTKEKLQQMQKDCLMKIDENCTALTEKHKIEIMRIVSEKLEAENSWVLEKQQFIEKNEGLLKRNKILKEQLECLERTGSDAAKLSSALQEAKATIESLKQNCEQLKQEKSILEKSVRDFSMENESLSTEVDSLKSRIAVLEMQSKLAKASKAEEQDQAMEIANLKELIQELEGKNETLTEEIDKLDKENKLLEFNLQDSAQTLKHMYKERDLLKNRITGLLNEIAALKSQTPEKHTFVDFVHLKRDYNALKEEHEKLLKRRSSKTNVLPTLKATDSTLVTRASSGGTVRSTAAVGRVGSFC
ncbi:ninein-like [Orbicella faveolata]|uniref:ninein-like n=1 Tax=Orbicella faveolata TaxID=48498 RepID=UPI0009E2E4C7|nr:ninein-like [Orbicella faveolata]